MAKSFPASVSSSESNNYTPFADAINKLNFSGNWQSKAATLKNKYVPSADSVLISCAENGEKYVSIYTDGKTTSVLKPLVVKSGNAKCVAATGKSDKTAANKTSRSQMSSVGTLVKSYVIK